MNKPGKFVYLPLKKVVSMTTNSIYIKSIKKTQPTREWNN
jgi:hypothetical protein